MALKDARHLSKTSGVFPRPGTLLCKDAASLYLLHLYIFVKMPKTPKEEPDIFLMSPYLYTHLVQIISSGLDLQGQKVGDILSHPAGLLYTRE
jgi:hypothetical protein